MTPPRYVRMADAPGQFGVSRDTLERRAADGCFPIYRPSPGVVLVKVVEVEAWIEGKTG